MSATLTTKQQFWLEHLQQADASGKTLAQYAQNVSGHSATHLKSLCRTDRNGFSANNVFHTRGVSSSTLLAG